MQTVKRYHVSDIEGINVFHPRKTNREDAPKVSIVWAVEERLLHNFLFP